MDLDVKCKSVQHLGENTRENLDELGYDDAFLGNIPKAWVMKVIIHKLNFMKI